MLSALLASYVAADPTAGAIMCNHVRTVVYAIVGPCGACEAGHLPEFQSCDGKGLDRLGIGAHSAVVRAKTA